MREYGKVMDGTKGFQGSQFSFFDANFKRSDFVFFFERRLLVEISPSICRISMDKNELNGFLYQNFETVPFNALLNIYIIRKKKKQYATNESFINAKKFFKKLNSKMYIPLNFRFKFGLDWKIKSLQNI